MSRSSPKHSEACEQPAYTLSEAAHYLGVPRATVRYWSVGRGDLAPLIVLPSHAPPALSFFNLVELHVLSALRRKFTVSMPKVRAAISYLGKAGCTTADPRHPLLSPGLETDGLGLFVQRYGDLIDVSHAGQTAMRQIIGEALHRIERGPDGAPRRLYPFTRTRLTGAPSIVVIDPRLSAGRPVISGTGVTTGFIAERYKAGESIRDLAEDYERDEKEIEEAIRCELPTAA